MNRVLAIVVTYNSLKWVERCFRSLRESSVPVDVTVVDNNSSDGTPDYIEENFPEARLFRNKENLGFGAANNIALESALKDGYEYVYLLNADAWIFPDTIAALIDAFEGSDGTFGVLSPIQFAAPGPAADGSGRLDPRFAAKCGAALDADAPIVEVPFVMAAHWLISRRCLEAVGLFSPSFPHYGEDDNWLHRARYAGFCAGVVPASAAVHDRAQRPATKAWRMKLKCISTVVKVSNPMKPFWLMALIEPLELVGMALKNASMAPIRFLPKLVKSYPSLLRTRRALLRKDL